MNLMKRITRNLKAQVLSYDNRIFVHDVYEQFGEQRVIVSFLFNGCRRVHDLKVLQCGKVRLRFKGEYDVTFSLNDGFFEVENWIRYDKILRDRVDLQ